MRASNIHGVDDEAGRGQQRRRRANAASIASVVARATGFITSLVSVPLTLNYLGTERFGLWMALSSALVFLSFADLGLGNGLMTSIAQCHGRDDLAGARRQISSAFILLSGIAVAVAITGLAIGSMVDFASIFSVRDPLAVSEARVSMLILVLGFALNMPLGVVIRAQTGFQGGFQSNLWQAAGNLLGLVLVLLAINFRGGLPWLVAGFAGGPLLATAMNFGFYFFAQNPSLRPSFRLFDRKVARSLFRVGVLFLVLQVAGSFAMSSDNFILASRLGADSVAELAVPARLFLIIASIGAVVTTPLWPAYGEAFARGDTRWVAATLRRSLLTMFLYATLASILLLIFGEAILKAWVGDSVRPSMSLMLALAVWTVLSTVGHALAMFMNGIQIIRLQVYSASAFAVVGFLLKWLLATSYGGAGLIWGGIIAFVLTTAVPYALLLPGRTSRMLAPS